MDDVFSGQPFGSAGLLWSLAMLVIEVIDSRAIWRDYLQDWLIASVLIAVVLLGGLWIAGLAHAAPGPVDFIAANHPVDIAISAGGANMRASG